MSSELLPSGKNALLQTDDHSYEALQAKLRFLSDALTIAAEDVRAFHQRMKQRGDNAMYWADLIDHANLAPRHVEMTRAVGIAFTSAAKHYNNLSAKAQYNATRAWSAQRKHAASYGRLDEVRRNRREPTPAPGFFTR